MINVLSAIITCEDSSFLMSLLPAPRNTLRLFLFFLCDLYLFFL